MAVEPTCYLGEFAFTVENGTPQAINRDWRRRWVRMGRIRRQPAMQDIGPDLATWRLEGTLFPGEHGLQSTIDQLHVIKEQAEPIMFTRGDGQVLGRVVIIQITESRQLMEFGGLARRIPFTIELSEYGDDQFGAEGAPLDFLYGPDAPNIIENFPDLNTGDWATAGKIASWDPVLNFDISATGFMSEVFNPENAEAVAAARVAGLTDGQTANVLNGVLQEGTRANAPGVLKGFGIGAETFTPTQLSAWASQGFNTTGMLSAVASGNAAPLIRLALDNLRPAASSVLDDIFGGDVAGARGLLNRAGTLSALLDVDPLITDSVFALIQP